MKRVIGVDIGGTSVKGIVTDSEGYLVDSIRVPTEARRGRDAVLASVHELIDGLLAEHPTAEAIGIASAGRINVRTGEVVYATNNLPGWQGTNLLNWTKDQFGLPAVVDNDANAALMGEAWLGSGRGYKDLVMITLGTGVGGANMMDGRLIRGAHWSGGEWGHSNFMPGGKPCNCGRQGCVEQYLSGTALVQAAEQSTGKRYASGQELADDLVNGDDVALQVMLRYAEHLATFIMSLQEGLDPEAVLIGGGVTDSRSVWWHLLEQSLQERKAVVQVRSAALGNDAGAYGAARMALDILA